MTYFDFLSAVKNTLTGITFSGKTQIMYSEINLEDFLELNPKTFPNQTGTTAFVCPIPFTIDGELTATYAAKIYIVGLIKEDASDRFVVMSRCTDIAQAFMQQLPDNLNGILYPVNVTPIILWDAQADGIYLEINYKTSVKCL